MNLENLLKMHAILNQDYESFGSETQQQLLDIVTAELETLERHNHIQLTHDEDGRIANVKVIG